MMFEKVNPMHPDKIADRIAGAMVEFRIIEPGQGATASPIVVPFSCVVERARKYIDKIGGFEALANWGLIR